MGEHHHGPRRLLRALRRRLRDNPRHADCRNRVMNGVERGRVSACEAVKRGVTVCPTCNQFTPFCNDTLWQASRVVGRIDETSMDARIPPSIPP